MRHLIMPSSIIRLLLCCWLAAPIAVQAESAFIIDQVEAGLHEDRDPDSPILKLLPTGSELEILARDGNRVQVRDEAGTVGWLDQRFLMPDKPTRQLLNEAEAELERTRAELQRLREQQSDTDDDNVSAERRQLRETRDRLETELAAERDKVAELRSRISELEQGSAATDQSRAPVAQRWLEAALDNPRIPIAAALVLVLIGMLIGAWLLDYRNRRRHGGFRI